MKDGQPQTHGPIFLVSSSKITDNLCAEAFVTSFASSFRKHRIFSWDKVMTSCVECNRVFHM